MLRLGVAIVLLLLGLFATSVVRLHWPEPVQAELPTWDLDTPPSLPAMSHEREHYTRLSALLLRWDELIHALPGDDSPHYWLVEQLDALKSAFVSYPYPDCLVSAGRGLGNYSDAVVLALKAEVPGQKSPALSETFRQHHSLRRAMDERLVECQLALD